MDIFSDIVNFEAIVMEVLALVVQGWHMRARRWGGGRYEGRACDGLIASGWTSRKIKDGICRTRARWGGGRYEGRVCDGLIASGWTSRKQPWKTKTGR